MGSLQKKRKFTVKQSYERLRSLIEFALVLLALMLPMFLLSSQLEKVRFTDEANLTYGLQEWLQSVAVFMEHL